MEDLKTSIGGNFENFYEKAFHVYFNNLQRYAMTMLRDNDKASDAVQAVFLKWWEAQKELASAEEAKAYLFTAVYRYCLNVIRNEKTRQAHDKQYSLEMKVSSNSSADNLMADQLDEQIRSTIDQLPPQCQLIFTKSRFENKRYNEIADELELSVKTVEAQMGKALKILREKLKDYV